MSLSRLDVRQLRNLEHVQITPNEGLNLLVGQNASGKTSLLEAIYLLGRSRSFRAAHSKKMIRHEQKELIVFGRVSGEGGKTHSLGLSISRDNSGFRAKVDGAVLKRSSELALLLPLLFISPDGDRLISGSPRQRRRFLDLGLFHVEHEFLSLWQRFNRALLQRNAALRSRDRALIRSLNPALIQSAEALHDIRRDYVEHLGRYVAEYVTELLGLTELNFSYQRGWSKQQNYQEALLESEASDMATGFTQRGPHRADLRITYQQHAAAQHLSGGQQKLLACALFLAQAGLYQDRRQRPCTILVDDLPAELDPIRRAAFVRLLTKLGSQVFITATDLSLLPFDGSVPHTVFHVEHGQVVQK